ncbi:GPI-anchored wall transfer protein 1 [Aureobasidium pullulans]|uniref:GPI-anchored wall transfer protein n=1 Tax=Aureobasidium pullulans TaxID=5580 RepID=A0A4S9D3P0_AURPU|nr:GPI-anchored wall transfer protein 1 [Aureobasidium pullulans]
MEGDSYIERKIDFVTGHTGSNVWDITQVTMVAPAAALLWAVLQTRQRFFDPYTPASYLTDFLLQVGAILFAVTAYADNPTVLIGLLLVPAIGTVVNGDNIDHRFTKPAKPPVKEEATGPVEPVDLVPIKPFVTAYRGAMMIITCISILAVDFPVFPRRFAKVENWGVSLMDLGVGSFVFGAGMVYARQALKEEDEDAPKVSFANRMNSAVMHSLPMLALGFLRLWTVKGLEYQEHVTEYGVHWNFFFTLGLLPLFVTILQPLIKYIPSYSALGFALLIPYEMLFTYSDIGFYMFMAPRDDFISANREGIFSFLGYLAIFIVGQGIGMEALRRDVNAVSPMTHNDEWVAEMLGGEDSLKEIRKTREHNSMFKLAKWTGLWIVIYVFLTWHYGPRLTVSRRLANMPYLAWVAAFNCGQLLLFRVIEGILFPFLYTSRDRKVEKERVSKATSKVLNAFNRNGLAIFCLANVLTGLVNMTLPTLDMNDYQAMAVLISYMSILTGVGLFLDQRNITIKL